MLMSVCSRYEKNKDDALAVLNQGFLKILNNLGQFQEGKPFEPWIKRIMINVCIDEFRKSKNYRQHTRHTDFEMEAPIEAAVEWNDAEKFITDESLEHMLRQLPPVSGQVFNLYAIDGLKHKEIADLLKISEGTSKWHLSHARQLLKKMLKAIGSHAQMMVL